MNKTKAEKKRARMTKEYNFRAINLLGVTGDGVSHNYLYYQR